MHQDATIDLMPYLMPRPRRRELLWLREGKVCYWCGCETVMTNNQQPNQATVDHVLPGYKGGLSTPDNVVSACYRCNNRRNCEDHYNLVEGTLLGKYKQAPNWREMLNRVVLSGDEKKVILGKLTPKPVEVKADDPHGFRADRDRLLQEVIKLRDKKKDLEDALEQRGQYIQHLQDQIETMTVWKMIKIRLIQYLSGDI